MYRSYLLGVVFTFNKIMGIYAVANFINPATDILLINWTTD